jgi:mRNA interferase RelE/StbE
MKEISFMPAATRQWLKLTGDVRKRIDRRLTAYAESGTGDTKALKGRPGVRLRVGDWRVVFIEDAETIVVVAVGHRREIYD